MNKSNERKMGVVLSYVAIIINIVIQLLYTPLLIRKLGQSEYGLYSLVASIIGYLTVMDFGFGNAIVVYTSKYKALGKIDEVKKMHGMFNVIFKIIGVIVGLLGIVLYFNVNNIFGGSMTPTEIQKMKIMMLILSFNLFLTFYFAIYNSIITAYEKFTFQKIVSIIQSLLKPMLMIPLLFLGYKSISLCIIITLANLFSILTNYFYCKKNLQVNIKFINFDKKMFKIIFGYSIWVFLAIIVDKINWSVDNFVLGAVSGTIAVSVYSLASTLNQLFINLSTAVSSVLLPKVSALVAKKASNKELTDEFIKVGRIQYLIVFLLCSGFILVGKEFFNIWAGKGYEDAYIISLILIIPVCIPLIQNLGISIMQAKNMHKFRSVLLACISIINIIISIPLAKLFGGIGAAIGTGLSLLVGNGLIINIKDYYKKVGIDVLKFWRVIIMMTIPNIIPIVLICLLIHFTNFNGLLYLVLYGGMYSLMYGIVVYLFTMNEYEKEIVNKLLIKIHLKKV